MKPTVSIIVPVYNVERYVITCLESIKAQTFKKFECIIVDDGSNDNSGKLCDEFAKDDDRFNVVHQVNQGVASARNQGLALSTGDYICFVDSDDLIHPDMLLSLLNIVETNDAEVAMGSYIKVDERCESVEWNPIDCKKIHSVTPRTYLVEAFFDFGCAVLWNKIYKRNCVKDIRFNQVIGEDREFNLQAISNCNKIVLTESEVYAYRQMSKSLSHDGHTANYIIRTFGQSANYYKQYLQKFSNQHFIVKLLWIFHLRMLYLKSCFHNTEYDDKAKETCQKIYDVSHKDFINNQYTSRAKRWVFSFFYKFPSLFRLVYRLMVWPKPIISTPI